MIKGKDIEEKHYIANDYCLGMKGCNELLILRSDKDSSEKLHFYLHYKANKAKIHSSNFRVKCKGSGVSIDPDHGLAITDQIYEAVQVPEVKSMFAGLEEGKGLKMWYSKAGYSHVRCKGTIKLPFNVKENYKITLSSNGRDGYIYHDLKWNETKNRRDEIKFLDCRMREMDSLFKEKNEVDDKQCSRKELFDKRTDPMMVIKKSDDNITDLVIELRLRKPFYWLSVEIVDEMKNRLNFTCHGKEDGLRIHKISLNDSKIDYFNDRISDKMIVKDKLWMCSLKLKKQELIKNYLKKQPSGKQNIS